jgi:hypothetical protein
MRIFSNILLSWPQVLHVSNAARLYPGRWQNYYIYRIMQRDPAEIISYSPIRLLQENREFYCYDRLHRDTQSEALGTESEMVTVNNTPPTELWITIPKAAKKNDVIAIYTRDDLPLQFSVTINVLVNTSPSPASLK